MTTQHRFRRPESVLVVVYTLDNQALVLRRTDQPDLWQSVTGSLEWQENPMDCAVRELREETGIGARPEPSGVTRRFQILPAWQERFQPGTKWNLEHEFLLQIPQPCEVVLNPEEHLEYQWLDLEKAASRVFSWTNRESLERLHET